MRAIAEVLLFSAIVAATGPVLARSSDRNQPMELEANQQTCDISENGQCVFTGNVTINQGTLNIVAGRAVIDRAGGDPSRAVLTGGPVVLKQQMDDGTPMTAKADRIDYDMVADVIVLTGNYTVTTQRGSTSGQRLTYNLKSGQVDSGGVESGGVKMRILPKSQRTQN